MDLKEYLTAIRRHWLVVAVITGMAAAVSLLVAEPPAVSYRSVAEIIVQDPPRVWLATPTAERLPAFAQEQLMSATQISLIRSREVLEYALLTDGRLAEALGLGRTLDDRLATLPVKEQEELEALLEQSLAERAREERRERELALRQTIIRKKTALTEVMERLKRWLTVEREGESQIVRVSAVTANRDLSQIVAGAVVDGFLAYSTQIPQQRIRRAIDRMRADQLEPVEKAVADLRRAHAHAVEALRESAGPSAEARAAGQRVEELTADLHAVQVQRKALARETALLRRRLLLGGGAGLRRAGTEEEGPSVFERWSEEIQALELGIGRDLRRLTAEHPRVKEQRDRIAFCQDRLREDLAAGHVLSWVEGKRSHAARLEENEWALRLADHDEGAARDRLAEAQARLLVLEEPAPDRERQAARRETEADLAGRLKVQENLLQEIHSNVQALGRSLKTFAPLVQKVSEARPAYPEATAPGRRLFFALAVGLALGVGSAYVLEYVKTTIHTEQDIRRYVDLPLLGVIPNVREAGGRLLVDAAVHSPLSEVFYTVGAILESQAASHGSKLYVLTSPNPGEGKSTVSCNVAIALARSGRRVILVDADLRRATLHRFLGLDNATGLTTHLEAALGPGGAPLPDVEALLRPTTVDRLSLVPAGPPLPNPILAIRSAAFEAILSRARDLADVVLVDTPPVNVAADAMSISALADGVVLLISAGETTRREIFHAKRVLQAGQARLTGCLLNKASAESADYYHYYYQHYYYSGGY